MQTAPRPSSDLSEVIQQYNRIAGTVFRGKADEATCRNYRELSAVLDNTLEVRQIMPNDFDQIAQLVDADEVHAHGTQSTADIQKYRVGNEYGIKRLFALIDPKSGVVYNAIYCRFLTHVIDSYVDLPDKIHPILEEECKELEQEATGVSCFSLCALTDQDGNFRLKGGGDRLINGVLESDYARSLPRNFVFSTFSPMRSLQQNQTANGKTGPELAQCAFQHVLELRDPTTKIHLRNGAICGDLKQDANIAGSADAILGRNVMASYVYSLDPKQRANNKQMFHAGEIEALTSAHLRNRCTQKTLSLA